MNYQIHRRKAFQQVDDAMAYILAVEAADGQALEDGVKVAINNFVAGCKSDGIWPHLKACCLLCGPRTLGGALVPLTGPTPTGNNLVQADYDRILGVKGNGLNKNINTGLANNAMSLNSIHAALYISVAETTTTSMLLRNSAFNPGTQIGRDTANPPHTWVAHDVGSSVPRFTDSGLGFKAVGRSNSSQFTRRTGGNSTNVSRTASTTQLGPDTFEILGSTGPLTSGRFSDARLAYYSIGNALDLALLDARVTNYVNAVAVALA